MYKSSKKYYFVFKYLFLALSCIMFIIYILISQAIIEFNKEDVILYEAIVIFVFLLSLILYYLLKDKFSIVELSNEKVLIKKAGRTKTYNWEEIRSIKHLQFITPPLYKLELKNTKSFVLFSTGANYISVNGVIKDLSPVKDYLKNLKE